MTAWPSVKLQEVAQIDLHGSKFAKAKSEGIGYI